MKFAISLMLFSTTLCAAPIQIFYESDPTQAFKVKEIFESSYQIPDDLIKVIKTKNCDELNTRGKLDLCLKNNGDLEVVSVDRAFINESLKIFNTP